MRVELGSHDAPAQQLAAAVPANKASFRLNSGIVIAPAPLLNAIRIIQQLLLTSHIPLDTPIPLHTFLLPAENRDEVLHRHRPAQRLPRAGNGPEHLGRQQQDPRRITSRALPGRPQLRPNHHQER